MPFVAQANCGQLSVCCSVLRKAISIEGSHIVALLVVVVLARADPTDPPQIELLTIEFLHGSGATPLSHHVLENVSDNHCAIQ